LLQSLVGVIDAQLLERIHFELLESKYVENSDKSSSNRIVDELGVAPHNKPTEQLAVDGLCQSCQGVQMVMHKQTRQTLRVAGLEWARWRTLAQLEGNRGWRHSNMAQTRVAATLKTM
jgi:hypothetical protein